MSFLDLFALFVLLVLIAAFVAVWVALGMAPGRIARKRKHPQADAINVCGWWGVITMGLLTPLAFIWAYTNPQQPLLGGMVEFDSRFEIMPGTHGRRVAEKHNPYEAVPGNPIAE